MKRIYNKVYKAAIAALMLTAATACTSEMPLPDNAQEPDTNPETGTLTTVTVSQDAGAQTRLNYQENGSKMDVTWKTGDEIYIGVPPAQGTESRKTLEQAGFKKYTCTEANGTQATFTSTDGLTGVASGTKLFTFHVNPKNALIYDNGSDWLACISYLTKKPENSTSTAQKEPDSFVEQRQTNNNSTAHISDYDFMYATADYADEGQTHFSFKQHVSLMKFTLQLPDDSKNKNVKKLELTATGGDSSYVLSLYRSVNLKSGYAGGQGIEDARLILHLGEGENGFQCTDGKLIAYLVRGDAVKGGIIITVTDTEDSEYTVTLSGGAIYSGNFYTVTADLTKKVIN